MKLEYEKLNFMYDLVYVNISMNFSNEGRMFVFIWISKWIHSNFNSDAYTKSAKELILYNTPGAPAGAIVWSII